MSSFGRYTIVEELERRGPYAVSSAHADGKSGEPAFAVKTYRNDAGLLDEDVFEREAGRFIECANLQKELAASAGKGVSRWAPIHEAGRTPDTAYYVSDLYPATAASLIDRRRVMTPREIALVMSRVVEGLEALQASKKRAHGRLTASNVMFDNPAELDESGVFLTDPEHARDLGSRPAEADINALGAMIFALVMYRAAPKGGSIANTPEWRLHRAQGEALRALCEKLINVQTAAEMPLEQIRAKLLEITSLKGAKGKSPLPIIAAAAVLLLGGVGAAAYFTHGFGLIARKELPPPPPPIEGLSDPREANAQDRSQWLLKPLEDLQETIRHAKDEIECTAGEDRIAQLSNDRDALAQEAIAARATEWPDVTKAGTGLPEDQKRAAQEAMVKEQEALKDSFQKIADRIDALSKSIPETIAKAKEDCASGTSTISWSNWERNRTKELDEARTALENARALLAEEGGTGAEDLARLEAAVSAGDAQIKSVVAMPDATPEALTAKTDASKPVGKGLREIPDAVKKASRDSSDRLAAYINSQRSTATRLQGDSQQLKDAFDAVFRKLGDGASWNAARQTLSGLEPWLTYINQNLPRDSGVASAGSALVDAAPFEAAFQALNVRAVEKLAGDMARTGVVPQVTDQDFVARVKSEGDALRAWAMGATNLAATSKRIEDALANAYGLAEPLESGKPDTLATLRDAINAQTSGSGAYAGQAGAVAPVLAKVRELEQVSQAAPPALLALIPANAADLAPSDRAKVLAAWDRLNEANWPATASDLDQAKALSANVKAVAAQTGPRSQALSARVDQRLKDMWKGFAGTRAGADPDNVNKAYATREAFAITDADVASLPSSMRFNFELIESRQALNAFNTRVTSAGPTELAELAGVLEGVSSRFKALGVDSKLGDLVPMLDQRAERFRAGKAGVSWADIGPGKGTVGPWTVGDNDDNDGTYVVYQWTGPSGTAWSIRFNRVNVAGSREVSYLATDEVPLGFFADLIRASNRGDDFSRLLRASSDIAKADARGPVGWATSGSAATFSLAPATPGGPLSANGWIATEQAIPGIASLYPAGINPEPPNLRTPAQYVSPMAATVAAGLVGCRLPLRTEMEAALALDSGSPNLRDGSWSAVYATFKAANDGPGAGKAGWPNGQIVTAGGAQEANPGGADSAAASSVDDGAVWFRGVDMSGTSFRDLIGNVAEFVIADPADVSVITDEYVRSSRNLRTLGSKLGVMGASALSPGSIKATDFVGLTALNASGLKAGFSDVGFRLAFSSSEAGGGAGAQPGKSVYDRLMRQGFLANQ